MNGTRRSEDRSRAQTTLDFAIAMGIFLLAIAFVFSFIPSLTAPFVTGGQDGSVTGDRIASHLAEGGLGNPNEPYVVNTTCADTFFNESTQDASHVPLGCGYDGTGIHERVGVADRHDVEVQLLRINATASGDDRFEFVCSFDNGTIGNVSDRSDCDPTDGDVLYATDEGVPNDRSTTVTRRIVTIPGCDFGTDGCDVTLRVKVR